ncbi:MAG: crosslink repair DNA glycosylase YcaQ family protein [Pseudomonadota bacterium]
MTQRLPRLDNSTARRLFLHAHGLLVRPSGPATRADIARAVDALGFVQVDSINTVARAHDHILWARLPRLKQDQLLTLCAPRDRALFEGWTHDAALIPSRFFPIWRHKHAADHAALLSRWKSWGRDGFEAELDAVRARLTRDGALSAGDLTDGAAQHSGGWWDWKPTKTALEYLWRSGELGICHRRGFKKYYDLIERIIPPEYLNARVERDEALDWCARAALDRLGFGTASELSAFWDIFKKSELAAWAAQTPNGLAEVEITGADGSVSKTLIHADWETRVAHLPGPSQRVRILSPFDPALRDRTRAARLFGFDYRIEVFVPEAKRTYGYYVFPVMEGTRLIGRIDAKADRAAGVLRVLGYWPEPRAPLGTGRAGRLADALTKLAQFSGTPNIACAAHPNTAILRENPAFMAAI